ncbi:MAG: LacI family DNA-binding transcriptional regulator [Erysipelotrichaceae bacterium]|jgi:LacI family transcriptional regulator|nr:LacI family DNA-binding transcriptional regulator [Erysipelotrichaceae bacterium]
MKKQRVTIRDVAKLANVSLATVSRAINTPELVNDETLKVINKAIEKLGFSFGVLTKVENTKKNLSVKVVYGHLKDEYHFDFISALVNTLTPHKISVALQVIHPSDDIVSFKESNLEHADLLILLCATLSLKNIENLKTLKMPLYFIANREPFNINNVQFILDVKSILMTVLEKNDYKNIYYVKSSEDYLDVSVSEILKNHQNRRHGVLEQISLGNDYISNYAFLGEYIPTHEAGLYITFSPMQAHAVLRVINENNLRLVQDYGLLSLVSSDLLRTTTPAISVLNVDYKALGNKVGRRIIETMVFHHPSSNINNLDVYYIKRGTSK